MFTSVCDEDTVPRSFLLWLGRAVEDLTPSALLEPVQLVDVVWGLFLLSRCSNRVPPCCGHPISKVLLLRGTLTGV